MDIDMAAIFLIALLLGISFFHVIGEILFKKGGMVSFADTETGLNRKSWRHFLSSPIVILSLFITLGTKALYGITLATSPLYLAGGIYLAAIAAFAVIGGRLIFNERIGWVQIVGFVLVAVGIVLLV